MRIKKFALMYVETREMIRDNKGRIIVFDYRSQAIRWLQSQFNYRERQTKSGYSKYYEHSTPLLKYSVRVVRIA